MSREIQSTTRFTRADLTALTFLALLFVCLLIGTWQRWTQPLIDHGREMNLPARILAGERLYADVQFLYGPFAPYFNATLYRFFGIHLTTLKVSGAVCALLIISLIYWLSRKLMGVWEAALTTGLVIVICALKSTANYIQPYAYAALYALVFALYSLLCTVNYLQFRGRKWLILSGVFIGLTLISKPEVSLAAAAAAGLAMLLQPKSLWRDIVLCGLPVLVIAITVYGLILRSVPLSILLIDNHILFTNMPPQLVYFNRQVSGLDEWPRSFWTATTGIGMLLLLAGLSGLLGALVARDEGWRVVVKRSLVIMLLGSIWWVVVVQIFRVRPVTSPFIAAPFVLIGVIGQTGLRVCKSSMTGKFISNELRVILVIAIFCSVSIARVILNVTMSGPYVPFFVPTLIIIYLYLLFYISPGYIAPIGPLRLRVKQATMVLIAIAIIATGIKSVTRSRRNQTYEISARRGSFITEPAIGYPISEAIRFSVTSTSPGDDLLVLPQGTSINFLAERSYPLKEEIIHPGFLDDKKEEETIRLIEERQIPLILIANLQTSEFRDRIFGVDYNVRLMNWITRNYHLSTIFSLNPDQELQLGNNEFFILAYKRNR